MENFKIILLIIFMFLLSGCGSDIKCTNSYKENIKYEIEVTADISKNNIASSTANMKFENSKDANTMCNLKKVLDLDTVEVICRENEVLIRNYHKILVEEKDKSITKDNFITMLKKDGFKC